MSESPHALVTGGGGFLGSHLVDRLLGDGYRVTSLDNFGSGTPANLEHVDSDRFESIEGDVREPFPDVGPVDHVYHLASRASPADFGCHPIEIATTNSIGTRNAFDFAREQDALVVLASTSEVYGDPEVHPQHERYNGNVNVRGPRGPYDESKRFAEALSVAYDTEYNIDIRTARIFNTYGPRMRPDDGRVIPNFLSQALRGDDLTVFGDGTQTRSFCYVTDLVDALRALADAPPRLASGEVFNVGSTEEVQIRELAEMILKVVDTGSGIAYKPLPQDDPKARRPDISKAKRVLEWEPRIAMHDGLAETEEFFRWKLGG